MWWATTEVGGWPTAWRWTGSQQVRSLSVLDLVPTYALYHQTNKNIASTYWQWYFLPQPAPYPESSDRRRPRLLL